MMERKYKKGSVYRDKKEFEQFVEDVRHLFKSYDTKKMKMKDYRKIHSLEQSVENGSPEEE